MKSIIVVAKNIEQAIEKGLAELNTEFENVDINVISEGGLFKKAKIEMILSDISDLKEEVLKSTKLDVKNNKVSALNNNAKQRNQQNQQQNENKKVNSKNNKDNKNNKVKEVVEKEKNEKELDAKVAEPLTNESILASNEEEFKEELKEIESQLKELEATEKKEKSGKQEEVEKVEELVKEFLNGLIYSFSVVAEVETEYKAGVLNARIVGENLGFLIGYRGEALDSIQYLINNLVINRLRSRIRVLLDIENYKKKREETLKKMATKVASRVQE